MTYSILVDHHPITSTTSLVNRVPSNTWMMPKTPQINLVQVMTSQTQRTRFSELGIRNSPINATILIFEDNHSQFTMLELVSISGR